MRRISFEEIFGCLEKPCDTLVLFHRAPDADAVGSAYAMKKLLEAMGSRAFCVCADELPVRLSFLMFGEQESVLPERIPSDLSPERIVSVDTASPSQLDRLHALFGDRVDLMIDHHGKGTPYADHCVIPTASASGEVLYEILTMAAELCGIEFTDRINALLYTAISADTGCFRYNNATEATYRIAADLVGRGVPAADINHKLFGIKTLKQMQVEHAGFERMNFYCDGRVAVITFPYELKKQYGADDEHLETLIDVARCVKGVEVAAVIKQPSAENKFRVSMRSSSDFDVSEVCAHYGGGGHVRAAGCTVTADSILSAEMSVVVAIEHRMQDEKNKESI